MDIIGLSSIELRELANKIAIELARVEQAEKKQAIERCFSIAHSIGMPLSTLMAFDTREEIAKPHQSYRDPTNPNNTWSGIGSRPEWLKRAVAAGVRLDQLRS